ncbi:MAG: PspC domain-containing protein [Deltaproteobacteria bacterium]|nr:MAG: PspC domain-containing protein [Deltaproteobacteria bacterium]
MTQRRLHRSTRDRMLAGVCGGIAETYDLDPGLVRLLTTVAMLGTGFGWVVYLVAMVILPEE